MNTIYIIILAYINLFLITNQSKYVNHFRDKFINYNIPLLKALNKLKVSENSLSIIE